MARFARIADGRVAEIIDLGGADPADVFHPDVAAALVPADGHVTEGWSYASGSFSAPEAAEADLDALKAAAKTRIDEAAERERLRYVTPGAGQAMTYSRKVEEARRLQDDADPEPEDYPMPAASIGIDGEDVTQIADVILAMDAQWAQIGAAIERARLLGKRDVDAAADAAEVAAVGPTWP